MLKWGSQSLAEQLTAQEVLKELDGVTEWRYFGLCLGIPPTELRNITESSMRKDIVHKWLEMGQASWQKLVNALVGAVQTAVAIKIASKFGK